MSIMINKGYEFGLEIFTVKVNNVLTFKTWSLSGAISAVERKYPGIKYTYKIGSLVITK